MAGRLFKHRFYRDIESGCMKLITTSWDDGHPMDLKLAELLEKYNLQGTFYIPKKNAEHAVVDENTILDLSKKFEIGGHTLNHVRLYGNKPEGFLDAEIKGCFIWLKDLLGHDPVSFCFPGGVINKAAINAVKDAGFKVMRTTELFSTAVTSTYNLNPTTLQVFDHNQIAYFKNTLKRYKYKSLITWMALNCSDDILKLVDFYLTQVAKNDGCFHLWGHSWEIEQYNLWNKLEVIFKRLSGISGFKYIQNKGLISAV